MLHFVRAAHDVGSRSEVGSNGVEPGMVQKMPKQVEEWLSELYKWGGSTGDLLKSINSYLKVDPNTHLATAINTAKVLARAQVPRLPSIALVTLLRVSPSTVHTRADFYERVTEELGRRHGKDEVSKLLANLEPT